MSSFTLAFADAGDGPPVVILHGLFGSKRNWTSVAERLAQTRRVLSVDLRNHGDSPWSREHDYRALAEDVAELIGAEAGGPAAVIGHSMGGKVAMVLALTRPQLVDRIVAVDIPPARSAGTPIGFVRAMQAVPLERCSRRSDVDEALAEAVPDARVRQFLLTNLVRRPDGFAWTVNLAAIERHFDDILDFPDLTAEPPFLKPALFLVGGRSAYVRPEHHAAIRRLFPAAEIAVVEQAGHWVHAEAPAAFLAEVQRFLA
jgi:esterase